MKGSRCYLRLLLILVIVLSIGSSYAEERSAQSNNPNVRRNVQNGDRKSSDIAEGQKLLAKSGGLLSDDKAVYAYYVDGYSTSTDYGVVSFEANKPTTPGFLYKYPTMVSAGAYAHGCYYVNTLWESASGFTFTDSFDKIDLKTGERVQIKTFTHEDTNPVYADMTFDYSTNTMYAIRSNTKLDDQFNITFSSILMKIDLNTGLHTDIGTITEVALLTLACTYDGQLWGIGTGGGLYKINKTTCSKQLVGVTGHKPWYLQSMEFDHTNGVLYWAAQTQERSFFAKVNTTDASVTEIGDFPNLAQMSGLYIPYTVVKPGAPGFLSDVSATYGVNGQLSTTLSWTNPTTDPFGTPLTQLTGVRVYRNDVLIRNYPTNNIGGKASWTDATVPKDGIYRYKLIPYNNVGNGEIDSLSLYVGKDIPGKPANVLLTNNNTKGKLTWEDPISGHNGGWYDKSTLAYKITRFPDNVVLEENFKGNLYDNMVVDELHKYYYEVEAHNALGGGQFTASNTLVYGPAVALPYSYDFETEEPFSLWSVVDNNKDGKSWTRYYNYNNWQGCYLATEKQGYNGDDYLIAPPMRLEAGKKYRITYDYRMTANPWAENFKVTIGKEPTHNAQKDNVLTDKFGILNNNFITDKLYFEPTETCNYYLGFYCYSEYYRWRFLIDNVKVEEIADIDLKALTIKGPKYPVSNLEAVYIVNVENNGNVPVSEYSVQLIDNDGAVLAVTNVNAELLPTNNTDVEIKWTPGELKNMVVKGKIVLATDTDDSNNITTSGVAIYIQPEFGDKLIDVGLKGGLADDMPFDFAWQGSIAQNLYYKDEMRNQPASIGSITYYNSFTKSITERVQIYMTNTEKQDLSDGWVPESEFVLVYDGNITFPAGQNEVKIDLQTPFVYNGTNLCVTTIRPYKQGYYGYNENFYYTETPSRPNRSLHASNHLGMFSFNDPIEPPIVKMTNFLADIMFSANQDGATVRGSVKSNGIGVEGVTIEVPELSVKCTSDEDGNYELPFVLVGNHTLKAYKLGYYSISRSISMVNNVDMTENFDLTKIPTYKVSGKVTDYDDNVIANAEVKLRDGYIDYSVTTNENGEFVINDVYAIDNYNIIIEHKMFTTYQKQITLTNSDLSLGNIKLYDKPNMPMRVDATLVDNGNVNVSWSEPKEAIVFRYDSGIAADAMGYDKDFPNSAIGSVFRTAATLNSISWYQGDYNNRSEFYNVYVFDLDATGKPIKTKLLYSHKGIRANANSWNTHRLDTLVNAPNGFMIAVGTDKGFICIGIDSGLDEGYPFVSNVHYYATDYVEGNFSILDNGFVKANFMIRAVGHELDNNKSLVRSYIANYEETDNNENLVARHLTPNLTGNPFDHSNNMVGSKAITGYEVWRLLQKDENDESKWTLLTPQVINTRELTDNEFSSLPQGVYKYGVKVVYSGANKSQASLSNIVSKEMLTKVVVKVDVNVPEIDPTGANVKLINADNDPNHIYNGIIGEDKTAQFNDVWKGTYTVEILLEGCDKFIKTNIDLSSDDEYIIGPYTLKETLAKPFNLTISDGEVPTTKILRWNDEMTIFDDVESHGDFVINSPGKYNWSYINDVVTDTYIFDGAEWPNMGASHAYIVFNPSKTTPSVEQPAIMPYSGSKFLGSFGMPITSDNFIISPTLSFRDDFVIEFMAKSLTSAYGLERMRVGYSLTDGSKDSFTWLHTENYIEVPEKQWTKYSFVVPKDARYVTINCVSNDALLFMVDDISIGMKNNAKSLVRYEVYLDGDLESETNSTEFEFRNVSKGKHVAGVKAVYTTGTSDMTILEFEQLVSVNDLTDAKVRIYPNPASDMLFVDGQYSTLKMFDMTGKLVLDLENGQNNIDIRNIRAGSYIIRIDGEAFNLIKK